MSKNSNLDSAQEVSTVLSPPPIILVVDDNPVIADSMAQILKRYGYAALAAYDCEGAIETALLRPPALLITDVCLPKMSGIELATILQRLFPKCKVILSSGLDSGDVLAGDGGS